MAKKNIATLIEAILYTLIFIGTIFAFTVLINYNTDRQILKAIQSIRIERTAGDTLIIHVDEFNKKEGKK